MDAEGEIEVRRPDGVMIVAVCSPRKLRREDAVVGIRLTRDGSASEIGRRGG